MKNTQLCTRGLWGEKGKIKSLKKKKREEGFRIAVGGERGCGITMWFTKEENYIGKVLFISRR